MTRLQGGPRLPIPTGLPFRVEEYRARHESVRAAMGACGMDLLYVTSPANLFYLTGYEAIWYPNRLPVAVAVDRESSELVFFDWTRHDAYVSTRVLCDEVVFLDYGRAPQMVADAFAQRGWSKRVIGIE